MRTRLMRLLPALAAVTLLACEIPGDGKTDVKGEVMIAASVLPLVVQPGTADADGDCGTVEEPDHGWGDSPTVGDVSPTLYVGLYPRPIDPRERNLYSESDASGKRWRRGCGAFDHDSNPTTPAIEATGSCPVGGTTGTYVTTVAGSNGGAVFEFEAVYVDRGQDVYLVAWLDNRCRDDNQPTANLVWDMSGPPSPMDPESGDEIDSNQNDIVSTAGAVGPIEIHGETVRLDEPVVLDTALSIVGF